MKKPTKKQAREHLIKVFIKEIQRDESELSNKKLMLNILMSGNVDLKIKVEDYKTKKWYLSLHMEGLPGSIYDFIDKEDSLKT